MNASLTPPELSRSTRNEESLIPGPLRPSRTSAFHESRANCAVTPPPVPSTCSCDVGAVVPIPTFPSLWKMFAPFRRQSSLLSEWIA